MPDKLYQECRELITQCKGVLQDLQMCGIDSLPIDSGQALPPCPVSIEPRSGKLQPGVDCRPETLAEIERDLTECQRCALCQGRSKVVFGVGNPHAQLVLVGEAPGREEDRQGYPFVGEAGQLLDRILFAMKLSREQVYICNVIKCRPPQNRDPRPEEIASCEPFLQRQLNAIRPRLIVTLGKFAAQTLLRSQESMGRLRGQWHVYQGIPLMPTYHPAYLLRTPSGKRDVWEDMKQVIHRLREEQS
ncbi:MAG: uracil-DNA glycosylase [Desulfuromonadales bacterium]|nr:uracil-DNA glycosylase [Desulfuromonadales bacterium]